MSADETPFDASQKPAAKSPPEIQWDYLAKGIDYIMAHPEGLGGLGVASANIYTVLYDWAVNSRLPKADPSRLPLSEGEHLILKSRFCCSVSNSKLSGK